MAGIFINYRREDASAWAGRLYERLAHEFKRDQLFMDVDNIAPGLDFVRVIQDHVGRCDVLLAVIGRDWVDARNQKGQRRLDDPNDFVRVELEAALSRDVRVIPVLVDGASMPRADELPPSIQSLVRRNAVELTHVRFGTDVQRLIDALAAIVGQSTAGVRKTFFKTDGKVRDNSRMSPPGGQKAAKGLAATVIYGVIGLFTGLVASCVIVISLILTGLLPRNDANFVLLLIGGFAGCVGGIEYSRRETTAPPGRKTAILLAVLGVLALFMVLKLL